MEVPGRFVDARQNGAVARLVIDAVPQPIIPADGETVDDAVDDAKLGQFLGRTVLKSNLSGRTFRRNLAPCEAVTHPNQFSGLDVLAILTVDLDRGMYSLDRDGVMAGAQVVYGSSGSLYVASHRYVRALELGTDVPEGMRTEIHRFDVSDPTKTVYKASGSVPGFILNNYALSEYNGDLRVASTEQPPWQPRRRRPRVLQPGHRAAPGRREAQPGRRRRRPRRRASGSTPCASWASAATSSRSGRSTRSTRSTSPTPTAPKVVGELKIPGYSAYLHPVGENLLLGVGREGQSVKASLFDVSNLAAPREVTNLQFPSSSTAVENEPHAFLFWAPKKLVVHAAAVLRPAVHRRRRRPRRAERAHRGRTDRPPHRRPPGERAGRALARDRRQALLAVVSRALDRERRHARRRWATRPFKEGRRGGRRRGRFRPPRL